MSCKKRTIKLALILIILGFGNVCLTTRTLASSSIKSVPNSLTHLYTLGGCFPYEDFSCESPASSPDGKTMYFVYYLESSSQYYLTAINSTTMQSCWGIPIGGGDDFHYCYKVNKDNTICVAVIVGNDLRLYFIDGNSPVPFMVMNFGKVNFGIDVNLVCDDNGNFYCYSRDSSDLYEFTEKGRLIHWGKLPFNPIAMILGPDGKIYLIPNFDTLELYVLPEDWWLKTTIMGPPIITDHKIKTAYIDIADTAYIRETKDGSKFLYLCEKTGDWEGQVHIISLKDGSELPSTPAVYTFGMCVTPQQREHEHITPQYILCLDSPFEIKKYDLKGNFLANYSVENKYFPANIDNIISLSQDGSYLYNNCLLERIEVFSFK